MNVAKRMKMIRMIEKINANQAYAKKIGLRDVSTFRKNVKKSSRA